MTGFVKCTTFITAMFLFMFPVNFTTAVMIYAWFVREKKISFLDAFFAMSAKMMFKRIAHTGDQQGDKDNNGYYFLNKLHAANLQSF